jgi:hypothetical protein
MAQHLFRVGRRYAPDDATDDEVWRFTDRLNDVGFRLFKIKPLKMMTWRGTEFVARYRNVYTDLST